MTIKYIVLKPRVLQNTLQFDSGAIVYRNWGCDYGLANDDTRATGVEHITITNNPTGNGWAQGATFCTIPVQDLLIIPEGIDLGEFLHPHLDTGDARSAPDWAVKAAIALYNPAPCPR